MDEYQHSLFFEAGDLNDREKEKIRRYFQKRRDSGGGSCAMIEKVGDHIYKVSFKNKQDQERVFLRKFHTVSLPGGDLCLSVSQTISPQTEDQPSASQSRTCTKPNAKCLEKGFRMDIFFLLYLQDNPKAFKALQKQLSSIGCTLELNLDEKEVVVMGNSVKRAAGAFGATTDMWELQVDRIFFTFTENYLCHHVLESNQVRKLLQDRSFETDDMKVYAASTYAVVVGETEAVKEKIALLEKSLPTQKELPVMEKQLELVKKEFSLQMSAHYPEVKVTRERSIIILEGPHEKVQSGAAKLDELIKNIKERRLQLHPDLLMFMSISGIPFKYQARLQQSLRSPVTLEVGSDLVLSSLSFSALAEAEAAVLRDLTVASVQLQGAAAVPPDLTRVQEMLNKAKSQANCSELRVDVSFIPASSGTPETKVQLVGYAEHVRKLKELLHDYQTNQVSSQEVLNLHPSELVDRFDKFLQMISMKQTNVTLKASHFPNPCVLLFGPQRQVHEALQALKAALASLTKDTLVLDGPGALHYFQGDGKVGKELIESSCQVLICMQNDVYSPTLKTKPRSIFRPRCVSSFTPRPSSKCISSVGDTAVSKINLEIKICSLEEEQVDVLVVPMLNKQLASTRIGKCLLKKGGNTVQSMFNSKATHCSLVPGDVLQVDASSSLSCSKMFFIECVPWDGVRRKSEQALGNGLKKCLNLCVQQGFSSVAIPIIGPGIVLQYPLSDAIEVLTEIINQFELSADSMSLSTIHIVIKPDCPDSEKCYHEVCKHLNSNTNQRSRVSISQLPESQEHASLRADLSLLNVSATGQQSTFLFLGLCRKSVDEAMEKLKYLYKTQCSTHTFKKEDLEGLTREDMLDLQEMAKNEGLDMQTDEFGNLTVNGIKDGVNKVVMMINSSVIRKEVERVREEDELFTRVVWCIQGQHGNWERLPKTANHNLENGDIAGGIQDGQGVLWQVDLQKMEATICVPRRRTQLKRLENLPDFIFPLYWDSMAAGEAMKIVVLQPSSQEYQTVQEGFKRTADKSVIKIERLQNIHLYRAYEAQKKHLSEKNKQSRGAGEKFLYHGTTQENSISVMNTGFNRSFAGQNATSYGEGTYFAVNASYSASGRFSRPAADGSRMMFVARVLTGVYTQGQSKMKVPPALDTWQPHNRYDSVVDHMINPSMYVVFHDSQAYPDYLITFQ